MSRRTLVMVVAVAHVCVFAVLALSGGCALEKKEPKLMAAGPVQEMRAPESEPESILEPKGMAEEKDLLVSLEPERVPAGPGEVVEPATVASAATPVVPSTPPLVEEKGAAEKAEVSLAAATAEAPSGAPAASSHTVAPGESLWKIARRYGITVAELAARNSLPADGRLKAGQTLAIPAPGAGGALAPESAASVEKAAAPAVAAPAAGPGEGVAQAAAAPARPEPARGPVIRQPAPRPAAVKPAPRAAAREVVRRHVVKKGETLSAIARAHGVSMKKIIAANAIKDPGKIRAGMVLTIPLERP